MDSIETITLDGVEIQCNGIIRNSKGRLIGRLVDSVKYEGEHVKGQVIQENNMDTKTNKSKKCNCAYIESVNKGVKCSCFLCSVNTKTNWESEFYERFGRYFDERNFVAIDFTKIPSEQEMLSKRLKKFIQETLKTEKAKWKREMIEWAKEEQQDKNIYWNEMPAITLYRLEDILDFIK